MKQLSVPVTALVLAVAGSASAQTPTTNPMPDGSRDMYAGLGAVSRPRYEGADSRVVRALPVLQVQWSNGVFISGMTTGMHLSDRPTVEYGPLLSVHPDRDEAGAGNEVGATAWAFPSVMPAQRAGSARLTGMRDIRTRVEGGAFLNYYLAPEWRLTSSVLYGAGNDRDGARMELGVQRLAIEVAPHHAVSFSAGVTLANSAYNRAYFGVSESEALSSGNPAYRPDGGLKDVRVGARWNWALSPSWLLTTQIQAILLTDDARHSPLVERSTNVTVSTAFAYRF
ncbi:MipA/OmpV family protein [Massilia sp.]|uniref:MipA/OmpV family protein n=1 Tax=Massilia sp. TaxID=1882437 RepID=UPI00289E6D69|nr:MipA/OmpV family protein [Massilia sp.]